MNTYSIKISLCLAYCFMMTQVFSQVQLGDSTYNYFIGESQPPADWNSLSFDDNSWKTAYSVIGYGNHNDTTKIDTCTSIYIRLPFEIESLDNITKFNLMADYSDGYIAYINGIEILRVNMGEPNTEVAHNELATRSRDMLSSRYQCNPLMGYFIDENTLQNCLLEGENILAIQVHNDSVADSNIGFDFSLFNISTTQYSPYNYSFKAINQIEVDSTTLPIIKIITDEKGIYDCSEKTTAEIEIIDIPAQEHNHYNDSVYNYKGLIGIEPRGQSSLHWPKNNYSIEFRNEIGEDSSVAVLGMPKESDWVLHGPFADRSQIRNALAYTLSNQIGLYAPRTQMCELFLNGEYMGLYVFMERIKRDNNRVDIRKLTPEDKVNITGGYIVKYDKGGTTGQIQIEYPKEDNITPEQKEYITNYFNDFKRALHDSVLLTERGYKKYTDIPSYLDFTIINELCRNPDAYLYSTYMYKKSDDYSHKTFYGPVWDFDLAFGNSTFQNADRLTGWQFAERTNGYLYHKRLFKDSTLVEAFANRWFELRNGVLHPDTIQQTIDSLIQLTAPAIVTNNKVWLQENSYIMNVWGQYITATYNEDIDLIKSWLTDRATWIDENIESIYYPYTYTPTQIQKPKTEKYTAKVFPNPCESFVSISAELESGKDISIIITNNTGKTITSFTTNTAQAGEYMYTFPIKNITAGIYTIQLLQNSKLLYAESFIKK